MKKYTPIALLLFSLFFLSIIVTTAQSTPQVKQVASTTIDTPRLNINSVTYYDHGVVVAMSYINFSFSLGNFNTKPSSTLYIYFFNSTTSTILYKSTLTSISQVYALVENGDLYVIVDTVSFPSYAMQPLAVTPSYEAYVYVFSGLRLVNTYTVNGLLVSANEDGHAPPMNLSALEIERVSFSAPTSSMPTALGLSYNFTIMLNNTNITLVDAIPVIQLQLPQGDLIGVENISNISMSPSAVPFNFTLYSNDGKIVWSKVYPLLNYLELGFIPGAFVGMSNGLSSLTLYLQGSASVVGDQLFVVNTTPLPLTSLSQQPAQSLTVNATLLGIDLSNGEVTTTIHLSNVSPEILVQNIGGQLYVTIMGSKEVTVERYNGSSLTPVAKIPLTVQVKQITIPGPVNITRNLTKVETDFFYTYGKYFLVANPTVKGINVTDIYAGGVTTYTLSGNLTDFDVTPENYALLVNDSNSYALVFLNDNGTVRGNVSIGQIGVSSVFSLITSPNVYVVEEDPYTYYVVKAHSNFSVSSTTSTNIVQPTQGETQVQVYEVNFPKPAVPTTTTAPSKTSTPTVPPTTSGIPTTMLAVVAVVIVVVIAVGVFVLRKRK
ncbi:hypothetical protein [Stygiolobus caldivivus]|uniref:Uncharacterized protein n=1 Tax=Stygiolobus caldivivus TaxID=2824673 RepID=A0A8D5U5X2_9CREN|nr:hypothetical protein [Stygiolobus caldivivus]BCU69904.1 hypothetical protein KN1_12010 [Stygiolobus caldivivus]